MTGALSHDMSTNTAADQRDVTDDIDDLVPYELIRESKVDPFRDAFVGQCNSVLEVRAESQTARVERFGPTL